MFDTSVRAHPHPRGLSFWFWIGAGALLFSSGGCGKKEERPASGATGKTVPAPLVEAVAARRGVLPLVYRVSGLVRAHNQVEVRPEIAAVLAEVLVKSGDAVERGQPLVQLEPEPERQALRQGEAGVDLALAEAAGARARVVELEAQASRTRKLAEQEMVSALERETQDAQLAAAQASVRQATARARQARATVGARRSSLDKTVIRSPIAGRVGRREVEVGMLVTPATVLFVVGDLERVILDLPITEQMLAQVKTGQAVQITGAALGDRPIQATVSRLSPFLAPGSFSTTAEVEVDNRDGRLMPGMFVSADISHGESAQHTIIPTSALWEDPRTGVLGVYVVDRRPTAKEAKGAKEAKEASKKAMEESEPRPVRLRPVKILAEGRATAGVEGVGDGEWVITIGQHLLAASDAPAARVRTASWDQVLALQARQQEDLLTRFLEKQRRLAGTLGAALPSTDSTIGKNGHPPAEPNQRR